MSKCTAANLVLLHRGDLTVVGSPPFALFGRFVGAVPSHSHPGVAPLV